MQLLKGAVLQHHLCSKPCSGFGLPLASTSTWTTGSLSLSGCSPRPSGAVEDGIATLGAGEPFIDDADGLRYKLVDFCIFRLGSQKLQKEGSGHLKKIT